ncbi:MULTISPECIES: DUF692 domain-containing protein [unclassified Beijerinckia]|uniref:MNIO family bufferin maturase n=1 Tax=unclassified Beijerinckia TaxID=2638183 RepID=UPI0008962412|nr:MULTISPECIES: DUF692 domain-containing protein [unclassified Beijerinckia]MDH7795314.1 uncharacterized protein (UPF0276 family) [Beijerinckia sp. GAS462]SEB96421.1 hypothetical protein SAMN05443249_1587 [Beijerinckia sp. 28-YEA-48]
MDTTQRLVAATAAHFPRFSKTFTTELVGTSFKHQHLPKIMQEEGLSCFFEVHAENYMGQGGPPHNALTTIRRDYPISLHGVCMSIGGPQPLDKAHIARFKGLIDRYQPALVSEHLAWSTHATTYFNDLLPLPYTKGTLARVCDHIDELQDGIGRRILIENPATYVTFKDSTMAETEFIRTVSERTGCGLLLDINNVFVSATNHGFSSHAYLADFPLSRVGQIHLAGHNQQTDADGALVLIDSHDEPVAPPVWALFETVIERCGPVPTLIEWDSKIPAWSTLKAEAKAARDILNPSFSRLTTERTYAV